MEEYNPQLQEETVVGQTPVNESEINGVEAPEKKAQPWKSVLMGGIPGILLGVGGVFATQAFVLNKDEDSGDDGHGHGHGGGHEGGEIPVADSVNDDMSFREAFEAARAEVGPGGAFSWHGNVYSTYHSDDPEWIEMGPEGQAQHCQTIVEQVHAEPYTPEPEPVADPEPVAEPEPVVDPEPVADPEPGENPEPVDNPEPSPEEPAIEIVGVEVDPETGATAAYGYVDGHQTVFADLDGDNNVDVIMHDANDDGDVSPDEVIDATDSGITIDELSGGPGYESDADLSLDGADADVSVDL